MPAWAKTQSRQRAECEDDHGLISYYKTLCRTFRRARNADIRDCVRGLHVLGSMKCVRGNTRRRLAHETLQSQEVRDEDEMRCKTERGKKEVSNLVFTPSQPLRLYQDEDREAGEQTRQNILFDRDGFGEGLLLARLQVHKAGY